MKARVSWLAVLLVAMLITSLYFIEISKIDRDNNNLPTLDNIEGDKISQSWAPFYKVRAIIVDGNTAIFSFPKEIQKRDGKILTLVGAAVFFGNGAEMIDVQTNKITSFFLVPSLGLAQSCALQPDVAMRWTIRVNLVEPWIISRVDMINAEAVVSGRLKLDTSKPYEAVFYLEDAHVKLKQYDVVDTF